jgi:hypothetical protein
VFRCDYVKVVSNVLLVQEDININGLFVGKVDLEEKPTLRLILRGDAKMFLLLWDR